jgi:hypothetical protein
LREDDGAGTKRRISYLTDEEKASFWLGVAVMRQIKYAPSDSETCRQISAVLRWAEHWLDADALAVISEETGIAFDDDRQDDDIPF